MANTRLVADLDIDERDSASLKNAADKIAAQLGAGDRYRKGHGVTWAAKTIGDPGPPDTGKVAKLRRMIETCGYMHDGDLAVILADFDRIVASYEEPAAACQCAAIQAADPRRHFKGCDMREPLTVTRDEPTKPDTDLVRNTVRASALADAILNLPRCVMGCGRAGMRYTTNEKYAACDEHASAEAIDLEYAPVMRELQRKICP